MRGASTGWYGVSLSFAALAAVLTFQRAAEASCSPPTCSVVAVDANCQPLPSGQPVSGDPLAFQIACTTKCCSGPSNCGESPYAVSAESLGLRKYVTSQGVETLAEGSVSAFSAHPSCPDVYLSQACVPPGKYAVQVMAGMTAGDIQVTQDDCKVADAGTTDDAGPQPAEGSSSESGCSMAERRRAIAPSLLLFAVACGVLAFRRQRSSPG